MKKRMTKYIKNRIRQCSLPKRNWKDTPCFRLIEKEYNKHFDYIIIICPDAERKFNLSCQGVDQKQ